MARLLAVILQLVLLIWILPLLNLSITWQIVLGLVLLCFSGGVSKSMLALNESIIDIKEH